MRAASRNSSSARAGRGPRFCSRLCSPVGCGAARRRRLSLVERGARASEAAKDLIEPPRFEMQLRHVPIALGDERAHRRQRVLAFARDLRELELALVSLEIGDVGKGGDLTPCRRELLETVE